MVELLRCQSCSAAVERNKLSGFCHVCGKQVCPLCVRTCDGCLLNFCMRDVKLMVAWIDQKPKPMKLCDKCKPRWAGNDWQW